MSNVKWNDVSIILRDDRLEFDVESNNDTFCIICKKVLVNAHNAPCGCRYCLDCITKYLNGENKMCPGNTIDCKEELLNINHSISIDHAINRKILKMVVNCPVKNCEFKDEVRNIGDHMRICYSRSIDCPYMNMGCKDSKIVNTGMKNHLLMEIVSHTTMLFELINNLKNDIQILKDDNIELKKDNEYLKKLIKNSEIKSEKEKREFEEKLKEVKNKFEEEHKNFSEMKKDIKMMKDETSLMKDINGHTDDFKLQYDNEVKAIKETIREIENKLIEEQKKNVNEFKEELKLMTDETQWKKEKASQYERETETRIDEINKTITALKSISNKSDESISNLVNELKVLQKKQEEQIFGEFVWKIITWQEKVEQARAKITTRIFSDAFYSHRNGYKMCLSLFPNGDSDGEGMHMEVFFHLMRGEFDDILSWPFKHKVTFELINQHTSQIHVRETAKYDSDPSFSDIFQKPISARNKRGFGYKFISLKELSNNLSLIDNDKIFFRCRVNIN